MISNRRLKQIAIVLLFVWILGLLHALSASFRLHAIRNASVAGTLEWHLGWREDWAFPNSRQQFQQQHVIKDRLFRNSGRQDHEFGVKSRAQLLHRNFTENSNTTHRFSGSLQRIRGSRNRTHHHHRGPVQRRKYRSNDITPGKELLLPKPIIVVGFPKAGTSSIFNFFWSQHQHLRCQHWYCCNAQSDPQRGGPGLMAGCLIGNLATNEPMFDGCGDFDVYAEINGPRKLKLDRRTRHLRTPLENSSMVDFSSIDREINGGAHVRMFFPQYFNLDDIHEHYPNATFVLNLRPIDSWIKSVLTVKDNLAQQFANEFYLRGEIDRLPDNRNMTEMVGFLTDLYQRHHDRVREFVRQHPSHTLVEVPIVSPHAGTILGQAFGLDPSTWQQINKSFNNHNIFGAFLFAGLALACGVAMVMGCLILFLLWAICLVLRRRRFGYEY